jgi:hypothetical protein
MTPHTVLLYGRSLLLSLVATSLARYPDLQVVQAPTWEKVGPWLEKGEPDVLIFDLMDGCDNHILPLVLKHPGLLMIGLDVEANQAVLISGQESRSLTLSQIRGMIDREIEKRGAMEREEQRETHIGSGIEIARFGSISEE